jgi:hypothetical protein
MKATSDGTLEDVVLAQWRRALESLAIARAESRGMLVAAHSVTPQMLEPLPP